MIYRLLFDHLLSRVDAETAHRWGLSAIRATAAVPGGVATLRRALAPHDPVLRVRALGRDLPGPLGLAAGFDKDAVGVDPLAAMGFGFVEVGTVTAQPQPGNPRPRLFRLVPDRAVVNRMGFNNQGAAAVAERLRRRRRHHPDNRSGAVVGVNIGKTRAVPDARSVDDYGAAAERLAPYADYLVVNVSSPNTPGLRDLQAVQRLRPLLVAVREAADRSAARRVPLLVKIAPDLADADIRAVADLAVEIGLDGIVATNTTVSRSGLSTPAREVLGAGAGGLSGAPLRARSLDVLRLLRCQVGDRLVLVSVGGVDSAEEAWARIRAGATLVQVYTAFVYGGPLWPARVHRGLAELVRAGGLTSVQQAVGTALPVEEGNSDGCRRRAP